MNNTQPSRIIGSLTAPQQAKTDSDSSDHEKNCIFCKIIARQAPATIIKETDKVIVIKSRSMGPMTNIRYLIIPKKHIISLNHLTPEDGEIAGLLLLMAQELSQESNATKQYTFTINTGPLAGQTVFHLHAHFETYS